MFNKLLLFLAFFLFYNINSLTSQIKEEKNLNHSAEFKLKSGNYDEALEDYLQLFKLDQKNLDYNYKLGVCYLNTNINKSKAVPYLENVVRAENHNPNAEFLLGRAYQYANRFDDAITMFNKYKNSGKGTEENIKEVDLSIQHCLNAKELIKFPIDITFQSLGSKINSQNADYYPFVTEDEAFMLYNSKRQINEKAEKMPNGQYLNSILVSKVINGIYEQSNVIGNPICEGNSGEEVIGMNNKGNVILFSKPNLRGETKLYLSKQNQLGEYLKPEELSNTINGSGDVIAACINNDGTYIYFASNRKGGFGGTDLYMVNKLPNGKWSEAKNLGSEINTIYDEDFPNLSPDNNTLYFSSKGHSSMGGYDIFKTNFNNEKNTFETCKNLGYPLNTSYDDFNFRISKNGRYGYVSAVRGGSMGDYDIYRVSFNEVELDYTVIIGNMFAADTTKKIDYPSTNISVNDVITNEIVGNYLPNPVTGRFIVILPPGKYNLLVESPGFEDYNKVVEIFDKVSYQSEISAEIKLKTKK